MSTSDQRIRVVAIDDTATWRHIVTQLVSSEPGLEMVGTAGDGVHGIELIERERPDVVTLDVEMPRMTGHEVLDALRERGIRARVIMLSSLTDRGARETLRALALGAVDFVCKPSAGSAAESRQILRDDLIPKIKALAPPRRHPSPASKFAPPTRGPSSSRPRLSSPTPTRTHTPPKTVPMSKQPEAVVIGVSTGGPAALTRIIPKLPGDLPRPVLIVQHMPPKFTETLANDLDRRSNLEVVEGKPGMEIIPGRVIIAPGGYHMTVSSNGQPPKVLLDEGPPIEACRPAVEKLFLSAADRWGAATLAVMLTGMGHDGQEGCTRFHELGAPIICQSPDSCVVFGMPRLPVERDQATEIVDLEDIAARIVHRVGGSPARDLAA